MIAPAIVSETSGARPAVDQGLGPIQRHHIGEARGKSAGVLRLDQVAPGVVGEGGRLADRIGEPGEVEIGIERTGESFVQTIDRFYPQPVMIKVNLAGRTLRIRDGDFPGGIVVERERLRAAIASRTRQPTGGVIRI